MLYYDKIDISEGRDVNNTSASININVADYDCNWIRTHNHLVHKRTLNHLWLLIECSFMN